MEASGAAPEGLDAGPAEDAKAADGSVPEEDAGIASDAGDQRADASEGERDVGMDGPDVGVDRRDGGEDRADAGAEPECRNNAMCTEAPFEYCHMDTGRCVECLRDTHCGQGAICDGNACFEPPPQGGTLCAACEVDTDCGGGDDLCLGLRTQDGQRIDLSCAQDCSQDPCPRGYDCLSVRSGSASQCRPNYEAQTPTCFGIRNIGASCTFARNEADPGCGLPDVEDAQCIIRTGGAACGVPCVTDDDCPEATTCSRVLSRTRFCL